MASTRFELDKSHTLIGFTAKHLAVATVRGRFDEFEGWLTLDLENPTDAAGEVTVAVASITSGTAGRDEHLRSGDFFLADEHPQIKFIVRKVEPAGGNAYQVTGDLTIRGVTKPVTLNATFEGETANPWGPGRRIGISASGQLNRTDFGLNWNGLAGAIPIASHNIKLEIEAELVESVAADTAAQ